LDRELQGQIIAQRDILPLGKLDLRGIVEELGVLDLAAQAGEVDVAERPGKEVEVESIAVLGVPAIGGWWEATLSTAIDRATVLAHAGSDPLERGGGTRVELPPRGCTDLDEKVAAFRRRGAEHAHGEVGRLPIQVGQVF